MLSELQKRSAFSWLFWLNIIYFVVGLFNIFVYNFTKVEYIQMAWVVLMALPLWIKPLGRWLNMKAK